MPQVEAQNTVNSRLAGHLAITAPRYYGQELNSWGVRITENYTRYFGLSLLRTPNRGPDGVCYDEIDCFVYMLCFCPCSMPLQPI